MYSTTTQIQLSPDQLAELVRGVVRAELADYVPPKPAAELPEFLTRKQTAELLQVSLNTLHLWAKDSDEQKALLVPQKAGTRVRYKREDVVAVLNEKRQFKSAKQD